MSSAAPLEFVRPLSSEDAARATFYGLIARLFYAPPDVQLLEQLMQWEAMGQEDEEGRTAEGEAFAAAWRGLVDACAAAEPDELQAEHTTLFIGTGKAEVTPYLSYYVLRHTSDVPLLDLRQQLAQWGLAGRSSEPEDHIAGVCEAMRFAIAVQHRSIEEQKAFFLRYLYPAAMPFCDAVSASPNATFYRRAAEFARCFLRIERDAFDMVG